MVKKFHTSGSDHGVELVSYIYGEMDDLARDRFETHLAGCDECAVEIGAYADARLGVIEWRRNDFEPLATPAIIIPDTQPVATLVSRRPQAGWSAWIETILALPRYVQAGMGLATAALVLGALYLAFVPGNTAGDPGSIANKTTAPAEVQIPEKAPVPDQAAVPAKSRPSTGPVPVVDRMSRTVTSNSRTQRAMLRQTPLVRSYKRIGPLLAAVPARKAGAAPTLNTFEDDEDTTLRLSDLFSQVGPRKK